MRTIVLLILIISFLGCRTNPVTIEGWFVMAMPNGVVYETLPEEKGEYEERALIFFNIVSNTFDTLINKCINNMPVCKYSDLEFLYSDGKTISKYNIVNGFREKLHDIYTELQDTLIINIMIHNEIVFFFSWDFDTLISFNKITNSGCEQIFTKVIGDLEYHNTKVFIVNELMLFSTDSQFFVFNIDKNEFIPTNISFPIRNFEVNDIQLVVFDNIGMYSLETESIKSRQAIDSLLILKLKLQHHPLDRVFLVERIIYYYNSTKSICYQFNGNAFEKVQFIPVYESDKITVNYINEERIRTSLKQNH